MESKGERDEHDEPSYREMENGAMT